MDLRKMSWQELFDLHDDLVRYEWYDPVETPQHIKMCWNNAISADVVKRELHERFFKGNRNET